MPSGRDVYLMAIQADQAFKWKSCLQFKQPDYIDLVYEEIQKSLLFQQQQAKNFKKNGTTVGRTRAMTRSPQQDSDQVTTEDDFYSNTGFTLKSGLTSEELKELRKKKEIEKNLQRKTLGEAFENLNNGVIFIKYGKWGKPKPRHVFMQEKFICWRDPKDLQSITLPKKIKNKGGKTKPLAQSDHLSD